MWSPEKSIAEMMDDLLLLTARALSVTYHRPVTFTSLLFLPNVLHCAFFFFLLPSSFCLSYPLSFELISTHYSSSPTPSSPHLLFLSASLVSSTAATRSTIFCSPFLSSTSSNCLLLAALSPSTLIFCSTLRHGKLPCTRPSFFRSHYLSRTFPLVSVLVITTTGLLYGRNQSCSNDVLSF